MISCLSLVQSSDPLNIRPGVDKAPGYSPTPMLVSRTVPDGSGTHLGLMLRASYLSVLSGGYFDIGELTDIWPPHTPHLSTPMSMPAELVHEPSEASFFQTPK